MYEIKLPVRSQDKQIRRAAFEQAFIEVLVRVSGNSEVVTELNIKAASKYVQQYRYLPVPKDETSAVPVMLSMSQPKHLLWVQFNQGLMQKLLRDNALPVWGQQRPGMLVWIAVRDGRNRYVLRDQDQSVIKAAVEKEAKRRGIPLIWPKFDAEDQDKVLFADLWGSFWSAISSASERYGGGAVLVGRMNWLKGSWQVNWSMELAGQSQSWQLTGKNLPLLMANGIDTATNNVSRRFAVLENIGNDGQIIVQINGVTHVNNYAKASRYLASLAPVKNVFATQVEGDSVRFNVDMTGNQDDLQRLIALGKTLVPDTAAVPVEIVTPNDAAPIENALVLPVENILTYRFN